MIRQEYIIAGCVLMLIGAVLCAYGYNKTRPTMSDRLVDGLVGLTKFTENISGEKAPVDPGEFDKLKSSKTEGYLSGIAGAFCLIIGFVLLFKSRTNQQGGN